MSEGKVLAAVAVMALMSYLPRVIPIAVFRKKITNKYIQSFLLFMPYAVLAAMVVPEVFGSTAGLASAVCGAVVAFILAYKNVGLTGVAIAAVVTVYLAERLLPLMGIG